jgi:hypothetical protein
MVLFVNAALFDVGSGEPLKSLHVSLREALHSIMFSSPGNEKNKGRRNKNILGSIALQNYFKNWTLKVK